MENKSVNDHVLKISGLAELSEPLEIDKDYLVSTNIGIVGIAKKTKEDGGFIYTYNGKQRTCEILKDNGQIIKAKSKGKTKSKLLRDVLWILWDKSDKALDSEQFYEREMEKIIENYKRYLD